MKTPSKIVAFGFGVAMVSQTVLFATASARENNLSTAREAASSAVCSSIDSISQKAKNMLSEGSENIKNRREPRQQTRTERRDQRSGQIETKRQEIDQKRQETITALQAKAQTEAQIAAVEAFKNEVSSAVATRRAAYDAARAQFRSGLDALIADQHSGLQADVSAFNSTVDAATASAKAACVAQPQDAKQIIETLRSDIKNAREALKSARESLRSNDQINSLVEARKQAFEAANAEYKSAMETARTTLKQAFGETEL